MPNSSMPTFENPFDKLQVSIPGMQRFQDAIVTARNGSYDLSITWIGDYLAGLYQFLIMVVAIFAAVTLIIGAVIWITSAGNPSRIGEAKSWIASSILGLVLALSAYLILYTVNPEMVILRPINLSSVGTGSGGSSTSTAVDDPGDSGGDTKKVQPVGKLKNIPCPKPKSGGKVVLKDIEDYFFANHNLTYSQDYRGRYDEAGSYFMDCSGFAQYLQKCLGLSAVNGEGRTYSLFKSSSNNRKPLTREMTKDLSSNPGLKEGDLIGYNVYDKTKKKNVGHVFTYTGKFLIEVTSESRTLPGTIYNKGALYITEPEERLKTYFDRGYAIYYIKR
ncbi:MAG: pilin [bacterium]